MLINFTDHYIDDINKGMEVIGDILSVLAQKEPFIGSSPVLDQLYAQSVLINGIIDHLSNDDNSNPKENEAMLLSLRGLVQSNQCRTQRRNKTKFVQNNHVTSAV